MNYKCIQKLNPRAFKRRFGVRKRTFKKMVKSLKSFQGINKQTRSGAKPRLDIEEQVLVTLEY